MASITATAKEFFDACETGKGWEGCKSYCTAGATFSAQAEPLAEVKTLAQYTDWMKGLFGPLPNASYEVKSFATDAELTTSRPMASFPVLIQAQARSHLPARALGRTTST
jgi:hypothetical protein